MIVDFAAGSGVMLVELRSILFVSDAEHPAVEEMRAAMADPLALRKIAGIVVKHDFNLPAFVAIVADDTVHGMVFGSVPVVVGGAGGDVVDPSSSSTWAEFSADLGVSIDYGGLAEQRVHWVSSGCVPAGAFRICALGASLESERDLAGSEQAALEATPRSASSMSAGLGRFSEPDPADLARPTVPPAVDEGSAPDSDPELVIDALEDAQHIDPLTELDEVRSPLEDILDSVPDTTIDAIRLAEIRGDSDGEPTSPTPMVVESESPEAEAAPSSADVSRPIDDTLDFPPGSIFVGDHPEFVIGKVCEVCGSASPDTAARCRGCGVLLTESNSAISEVPRPALGQIVFEDETAYVLGCDLIVGRNPERTPLGPNEAAVVVQDPEKRVSRRHLALRLDGWSVMAVDLGSSVGTTVERSTGGAPDRLVVDVPRSLSDGDRVNMAGVSFVFKESTDG